MVFFSPASVSEDDHIMMVKTSAETAQIKQHPVSKAFDVNMDRRGLILHTRDNDVLWYETISNLNSS